MATLWELGKDLEALDDALEDATDEEAEQILADWFKADADFNDKALSVSRYIIQLGAIAYAQREEELRIQALRRQKESLQLKLKDYLSREMLRLGKTKIEGVTGKVFLRRNAPVVSILTEDVPLDYLIVTTRPDMPAIKESIKSGEIDWAELKDNGHAIVLK